MKSKFFKQNIPYLAFFYVGNIFSHHVRAYTGGDVIDKILGQYVTTYVALGLVILISIYLYKTKFGLRLIAVGEHPKPANNPDIITAKYLYK